MRKSNTVLMVVGIAVATCAVPGLSDAAQSQDAIWLRQDSVPVAVRAMQPWVRPERYTAFSLDAVILKDALGQSPMEFTQAARKMIYLPMPDGTYARFGIVESPVMHPDLARKFPEIKTYAGQGVDDPAATVRLDWTPSGFHAQILSPNGAVYIDPYSRGDTRFYTSYYKRDHGKPVHAFECLTPPREEVIDSGQKIAAKSLGGTLRTFRLAVAAQGEYTQFHGGTVALGMAAIVTTINRVSGIYENDLSVRLQLVPNNSLIVYTNPGTDPYTSGSAIDENQAVIDGAIGNGNYDIGHVFNTTLGGAAGLGVVCDNGTKAEGETGRPNPVGDSFYVDYVAHEMGHQFNANHTFNGSADSCGGGNRNASTAYEPGSGSTILAYAGICGSHNLQAFSDAYFHFNSIQVINNFVTSGAGSGCAATTATGNSVPTVSAGSNYTIPMGTPFALTATGHDDDSDMLTYTWEERDTGSAQAPSADDNGSSPIFRSFSPTTNTTRTFPRLSDLLNNTTVLGEQLPSKNRTLRFRVTVRDNRSGGGGVAWDNMSVTVNNGSGPFLVTSPNTAVTWSGQQTVTWNVAGTAGSPVNAGNVNILLSVDGGSSFPTVLASGTPNDGSQVVALPNSPTTTARIKVEGAGNVFFDVSNTDFEIVFSDNLLVLPVSSYSASGPQGGPFSPACMSYSLTNSGGSSLTWTALQSAVWFDITPGGGDLLAGESVNVDVCVNPGANSLTAAIHNETLSFSNRTSGVGNERDVILDVASPPLPSMKQAGYTLLDEACLPANGVVDPGETVMLNLGLRNSGSADTSSLVATLLATGGVTSASGPQNYGVLGTSGVVVVRSYTLAASGSCGGSFTATLDLQDGPIDLGMINFEILLGGSGGVTQSFSYAGAPVSIPDNNPSGVNIPLLITGFGGAISDLDFSIDGTSCSSSDEATGNGINHTGVGDLVLTLSSPGSTSVILMQNPGSFGGANGNNFCNTVLDDDGGGESIQGIPDNGHPYTGSYLPFQSLSAFDGEDPNGTWNLHIKDTFGGDTGDLRAFSLSIAADAPECCVSTNAADGDGDGIPDDWEQEHGLNPFVADATNNADGDFFDNFAEWIADTDPTNPASFFRIDDVTVGSPAEVFFESSTGRIYTLWYLDVLNGDSWSNIPGRIDVPGQGGSDSLDDSNAPVRRFYQLEVQLP